MKAQTLQDDVNLRAMDLMDRDSVHVLVSNIMENKVLDKSAMGQFENIDDYVTTRNQNLSFRGLLFPRIYRPQGPVLKFLTVRNSLSTGEKMLTSACSEILRRPSSA